MSGDKLPTGRIRARYDSNRRDVLKLLGTGVGIGVSGVSTTMLTSRTSSASHGTPGVRPQSVSVQIAPGESTTVGKHVRTPEIPPKADIFLLEDETGSFGDDIDELQALAPSIWDEVDASATDFAMGVGGFRDYAQSTWGSSRDWVYRRTQDLTTNENDFVAGVDALTAGGGNDFPEGYLEALHYIAVNSHGAIDSNGDGDTVDANDTATGRQPSWRSGSTRIVLLATDADCHEEGDAGGWPGHQSSADLTVAETVNALDDAGITVIGLTPGGSGDIACVDDLAAGTGGSVHATTASGDSIGDAIVAGLSTLPAEVTPSATCDDGLTTSFDPDSETVTSGDTAFFDETISVDSNPPIDGNEGTLTCTVDWLVNGESLGDAFVQDITVEVCTDRVVELIADGGSAATSVVVGSVTVSEAGDDIEVTYSLNDDWFKTRSHLHLATDCGDIPQTGAGNPTVGKFEFSRSYDPAVQTDTYVLDQAARGFEDADDLCIAAHAEVFQDLNGNDAFDPGLDREETAWGDGERFTDRGNWATHFGYEVCD